VVMAVLHAVSALGVLILANGFSLPVTATYLQGPPGSSPGELLTLFDVDVAWAVAIFLLLSAFFHVVVASPWFYQRYRVGLEQGRNNFRWVEYSLSASLMIVLIAMITGILDISALIPLFGVNAAMIFFGAVQEKYEKPGGLSCRSGWDRLPVWSPGWPSGSISSHPAATRLHRDSSTGYSSRCSSSSIASPSTSTSSTARSASGGTTSSVNGSTSC